MAGWVRVCSLAEAPAPGQAIEAVAEGTALCLANVRGELCAIDNRCPHRGGPLAQGIVEGETVICPWHSWTFNLKTGVAEYPVHERVAAFPVRVEDGEVLVEIALAAGNQVGNLR